MISITLPLLGLSALGAAQSSTVSLFLPMADPKSLVASIAGSDSTATTYVVTCANSAAAKSAAISAVGTAVPSGINNLDPNSFDNSDCGFPSAFRVIEGPSTVHYSIGAELIAFKSINCALSGTTYAECTASASASADTSAIAAAAWVTDAALHSNGVKSIMTTTTLTGSDAANGYLPVVVTAGAANAKPAGAANAKPASGASATTAGSAAAESTGTATSKESTPSTSSGGAPSQTSNAAVGGASVVGTGILGAFGVAVAGALL
ncbi:hypothetical protein ABVK25_009290 [Lepraria finkii]|uniref:Uncharacterized protein n=1 Tax=Lepraria finkii TaxID=1340010 RepID=A0ABR4AXS7_9LECA